MRALGAVLLATAVLAGAVGATIAATADPTKLPLGDGRLSTSGAKRGLVYSCGVPGGGGGAQAAGPWIEGATWDSTKKATVDGAVRWTSTTRFGVTAAALRITGNALPRHGTSVYPIAASDDAYQYDRNPNAIRAQTLAYSLPASPRVSSRPACLGMGPIGVMLTGAFFFNALDAEGRDAVAHELQDACDGHPERGGQYHYHSLSPCADAGTSSTAHSKLVGYALDGFGIYGLRGERGTLLSNADLDACHGHTHVVTWRGRQTRIYHYHATLEYPYTLGCYRGTPARAGPR